ncbi:major facilitator superfamily domain-containing protein [Talaromyces proteolyticus]|uniref:Major facilitator superfamily domain-containing protein n=1 Tax=Talaromyces proteolyticus TaxID=1131652 RepID=A0AAD4L5C0_9EURO|nr:major facilitator superfamily domain-containing protein [Talaromyces proteolyticus]KAH8704870.1 major facilitator superfamily domain-containing protein [Talaromyces proteolyticus]
MAIARPAKASDWGPTDVTTDTIVKSNAGFRKPRRIIDVSGEVVLVLDSSSELESNLHGLKLAKDGHTVLVPQPSDNEEDPMNWKSFKKHAILLCLAFAGFATDFSLDAGIPTVAPQAIEWQKKPQVMNYPNNIALVSIGISSIIWVPLMSSWGRAPVLFWSTLLGLLFTLGTALVQDYNTYYVMRVLQNVTQGTGATLGVAFIQDMFFLHERARKLGLWYCVFLSSPFVTPLFGYFMVARLGEWRPVYWLVFALTALLVANILIHVDESYWNRSINDEKQPRRFSGQAARLSRLVGVWQIRNHVDYFHPIIPSYVRLFRVASKPIILITVLTYSVIFMWGIGINATSCILLETPEDEGGYGLSAMSLGYMYFTPIVAVCLGEAVGHYLNDFMVLVYTRSHDGRFVPEARLWSSYVGGLLMIPGLVLVGQTLKHHLHWSGIVFGWGMYQMGVMLVSVAIVAYLLDCYPSASPEISAWVNIGRTMTGFAVGYFQQPWGLKQGYDVSFGLQVVIVAVAFLVLATVQGFGARIRKWSGPLP